MRFLVGLVSAASLLAGCEGSNAQSCLDGTCSDPERPYCDADGFFSGTNGLCIHVDCSPNAFERCIGDEAQSCTADGGGYKNVLCPNGCGTTGCISNPSCETSAECTNPNPVCDAGTQTCRACMSNDECSSTVCEQGACLPEASIVYASPTGAPSGNCSRPSPCNLGRAAMLASSGATGTLRLLPGIYSDVLTVTNSSSVTVYAKGATIAGNGRLAVTAGDVTVRDLSLQSTGSTEPLTCIAPPNATPRPRLTLRDVSNVGGLAVAGCTMDVERYTQTNGNIRVDQQGTLVADRSRFESSSASQTLGDFVAFAAQVNVRVTNSQIVNYWLQFNTTDLGTMNSVTFAYSTLVATYSGSGVGSAVCATGAQYARVGTFENNIIVAPSGIDAVMGTSCTLTNNVLFPQSAPRAGNIIADPQFENAAAKDFRPKSTSPARNAAMPGTVTTDHDFTGAMRPQGAGADIGAYEIP